MTYVSHCCYLGTLHCLVRICTCMVWIQGTSLSGQVVDGKIIDPMYKERQEEIYKRISTLKGMLTTTNSGPYKECV